MRESLGLYRRPPGEPAWAAAVEVSGPPRPTSFRRATGTACASRCPWRRCPFTYRGWSLGSSSWGQFIQRHVRSLDELGDDADVVVNCAGLGALELIGDHAVHPVRGQIVR